jgi:hypothetical protein
MTENKAILKGILTNRYYYAIFKDRKQRPNYNSLVGDIEREGVITMKSGDLVDVRERELTHLGQFVEILPNQEARIHMKTAKEPKERGVCDQCGSMNLSLNGGTGEITCIRTGCGHDHGFREWDEIIPVVKLINITERRREEAKIEFREEVKKMLVRGHGVGFVTTDQCKAILEILKR